MIDLEPARLQPGLRTTLTGEETASGVPVFHRLDTGDQAVFCVHFSHRAEPVPGSIV
jgi:hypothetical protein